MKTKQIKKLVTVVALSGIVGSFGLMSRGYAHCGACGVTPSHAHDKADANAKEKECRGLDCERKAGCGKKEKSLDKMFHKKVHFLRSNQDAIGLSDGQINSITNLKNNLEKKLIAEDAKIDTLKVDIRQKLHERNIDVSAVNSLVTQKYEAKKSKSTATIQALADLKKVLSDEQYDAMKRIWDDKWKDDEGKGYECPYSRKEKS